MLDTSGIFYPISIDWTYIDTINHVFFSSYISGAQRLENGNTLICDGAHGTFFEIDIYQNVIWRYVNPVLSTSILSQGDPIPVTQNGVANSTFRCTRLSLDHPGLSGRNLMPGNPIELYPLPSVCNVLGDISISTNEKERIIVNTVDILGRHQDASLYRGLLFYIYSDGYVEKRLQ